MTRGAYRTYQAFILVIWIFFLLIKFLSGDLRMYIGSDFILLYLFAIILLMVLAQNLLTGRKLFPKTLNKIFTRVESRNLSIGLILMLFPLLISLVFSGRSLGPLSLTKRGVQLKVPFVVQPADLNNTLKRPESNWNILDWMIVSQTAKEPILYNGDPVSITGLVYLDHRADGDQLILTRFLMNCCKTEAVAIGIPIEWAFLGSLATGEWVNVEGQLEIVYQDDKPRVLIHADAVIPVPEPDQPYLLFR